jgi:hypothetical protein
MSHFLTLVLIPSDTEDVEAEVIKLLAPYDENLEVEPRKEPCWCMQQSFIPINECEDCRGTGQSTTTRNPKSKWDWWTEGGRWDDWADGRVVVPVSEAAGRQTPFAIVTPDGEWRERGEMGWFAMVSNEKNQEAWANEVRELIERHTTCSAVVIDCHI